MKHLEVRQKYSAARRIFNSLLGVSSGDETLRLMFDILRENRMEIITSSITSQSTSKTILNKEISTYSGAHDYLKIIKDHTHIYFL